MKEKLTIVDVELVAGNSIGVRLSDDTVLLVALSDILRLEAPSYILWNDDDVSFGESSANEGL